MLNSVIFLYLKWGRGDLEVQNERGLLTSGFCAEVLGYIFHVCSQGRESGRSSQSSPCMWPVLVPPSASTLPTHRPAPPLPSLFNFDLSVRGWGALQILHSLLDVTPWYARVPIDSLNLHQPVGARGLGPHPPCRLLPCSQGLAPAVPVTGAENIEAPWGVKNGHELCFHHL